MREDAARGEARGGWRRARRELPESRERMRRFRYRPAAGRVSRARSLTLALAFSSLFPSLSLLLSFFSLLPSRPFSLSLLRAHAVGSFAFRVDSLSLSLAPSFSLFSSVPYPSLWSLSLSLARSRSWTLSLPSSVFSSPLLPLSLLLSCHRIGLGGAAARALLSLPPSFSFSLIRSRRSRLPSSSRRSESNRL